ncbi:hypothetical protein V8E54_005755 [Elaphomyces granulatus]
MPTLADVSKECNNQLSRSRSSCDRIKLLTTWNQDPSFGRSSSESLPETTILDESPSSSTALSGVSVELRLVGSAASSTENVSSRPSPIKPKNTVTENSASDDKTPVSPLPEQISPDLRNERHSHSPSESSQSCLISPLPLSLDPPQFGQPFALEATILESLGMVPERNSDLSASSQGFGDDRASSCYSRRSSVSSTSSAPSVEDGEETRILTRQANWPFSIISPVDAGVFDDTRSIDAFQQVFAIRPLKKRTLHEVKNKPLPPDPPAGLFPIHRLRSRHIIDTVLSTRDGFERTVITSRSHLQQLQRLDEQPESRSPDERSPTKLRQDYPMFSRAAEELEDELAKMGSLTASTPPPNVPRNVIEPLRTRSPSLQVPAGPLVMEVELTDVGEAGGSKASEEFSPPGADSSDSPNEDVGTGSETENEATSEVESSGSVTDIETNVDDTDDAHSEIINITIEVKADDPLPQSDETEEQQGSSLVTATQNPRPSSSSGCSEKTLRLQLPRLRTDQLRPPTPNQGNKAEAATTLEPRSQHAGIRSLTKKGGSADQKIVIELSKPENPDAKPFAEEKGGRMRDLESRSRPPLNETELVPALFELDAGLPSATVKSPMGRADVNIVMPANLPDKVILSILEQVDGMTHLFHFAVLNKSFYRVFKKHEMHLIRNTMFHMSPAAWELREMSPPWDIEFQGLKEPDAPVPEYTPSRYLSYHTRDMYIVAELKALIVVRCSSFLPRDTTCGLAGTGNNRAGEVDDALWRIWTFCRIFGCGKSRENDLNGQMDWLNGGRLANQQRGGPCLMMAEPFFSMNNVFFDPPPGFGRGNGQGLSHRQIYDMTEIWTCLGTLLQPLHGKVAEARQFGVYDDLDVAEGDTAREETLLEEWTYYVLTLGPFAVLSLSSVCRIESAETTFRKAQQLGLTKWEPPEGGTSRASFLREAVARSYETRISGRSSPSGAQKTPRGQSQESSQRGGDATSIRTDPTNLRLIQPHSFVADRSFLDLDDRPSNRGDPDQEMRHTPEPQSCPTVIDPVDKAISMMVNKLGFREQDAKWALKITDMGDALDVDAAIRLLNNERKKRGRNHLFSKIRTSKNKSSRNTALVDPVLCSNSGSHSAPGWRWA